MAPFYNYVVWLWIIYLSHPWSGEGQALSSLLSNFFPANEHTQTGSWLQIVEVTIIPVGVSVTHSLTCSLFSLPAIIFVPDYFILSLGVERDRPSAPSHISFAASSPAGIPFCSFPTSDHKCLILRISYVSGGDA